MSRCCDIPFFIAQRLCILLMLAFAAPAAAQEVGFHWVCDPTERHTRFYRADLGVVCWDGRTYSHDNGGIPQHMLDYFEQNSRKVKQKVDEMNRHIAEIKAAAPANNGTPRPGPSAEPPANPRVRATVAPAETTPVVPVAPEVFASIGAGMPRTAVLDKLGKPPGSITIPGDEGFIEIWTYQLTDGSAAKLKIEKGVVLSREPKTAEHER